MSEDLDDRDYDVGYGKPPKRTQFKKGQSGNPKGRPKGAKGFKASLKREYETQIPIQEGGRTKRMTKVEVAAKRFMNKALTGDLRAMTEMLKLDSELYGDNQLAARAQTAETPALSPEKVDFEILRDFFQQSADDDGTIEDGETDHRNTDTEEWDDDGH